MGSRRTDILVVGKTGHGKSATANSIVGYRAFKSRSSQEAVTLHTQFEVGEFEGRILKVVDGPGVGDTRLNSHDGAKLVIDAMNVAVAANPAGYHCILVVMRYGSRCTNEEIEVIHFLKQIFGENFIKNHAILLMTCGDNFDNDDEFEKFEEWAYSQTGYFMELVNECCRRVILFDNTTKDNKIKQEQMRKLLKIIDNLAANGERYTSDIFMKAQEARDHLLSKLKKKTLKDETVLECGLINQKLNCIDFGDPENAIDLLGNLRQRSEKLQEDVKQQDQGTNSLSEAMKLAQQFRETITEQDRTAREILQMKQKMEQMELQQKMERVRLEAEECRRKEDERRRQEEAEKRQFEEQLDKQRRKHEKLLKEKEEEMKRKLESVKETYETVKEEETWTWGGVASALAGPAITAAKWWFGV